MNTVNKLGKISLLGLAGYGLISLVSNITPESTSRQVNGSLSSGMGYTFQEMPYSTPYNLFERKSVISFCDGITVEDPFMDGYIGPFDIEDHEGNRIISSQQFSGNENRYAHVQVDDTKRKDLLGRVAEVYQQHGIEVEITDI